MNVNVNNGKLDQAVKILKKRLQRSKLMECVKEKKAFMKKSAKRALEKANTKKTIAKYLKKRMQKEGF